MTTSAWSAVDQKPGPWQKYSKAQAKKQEPFRGFVVSGIHDFSEWMAPPPLSNDARFDLTLHTTGNLTAIVEVKSAGSALTAHGLQPQTFPKRWQPAPAPLSDVGFVARLLGDTHEAKRTRYQAVLGAHVRLWPPLEVEPAPRFLRPIELGLAVETVDTLRSPDDLSVVVADIERRVTAYDLLDRRSVLTFLVPHGYITEELSEAPRRVATYFGSTASLALRVAHDPDGGIDQLVAAISTPASWPDASAALDRFDEEWWLNTRSFSSGLVVFTLL